MDGLGQSQSGIWIFSLLETRLNRMHAETSCQLAPSRQNELGVATWFESENKNGVDRGEYVRYRSLGLGQNRGVGRPFTGWGGEEVFDSMGYALETLSEREEGLCWH